MGGAIPKLAACRHREFRGDELQEGFTARDGEVLTAAVLEFRSRAHQDDVMSRAMKDRGFDGRRALADMKQMRYGGFETFVES